VLRTLYCVENYLYVATCWIVSLCAELIVYSELIKLCNTRGYPIPACYPTGTCTGTKFSPTGMVVGGDELCPWVLSWAGICSTCPVPAPLPYLSPLIGHLV
jgi:hypothetical protein